MADLPQLTDWDESFPSDGFAMIIAGTRRGGKSTAIQYFYLEHWRKTHDSAVVFTSSANKTFYEKLLGEKGMVLVGFSEPTLLKLMAFKEKRSENKLLMIFDDSIGKEQKNSETITQVFTRGRHIGISLVFATQSITQTNTDWRRNVDIFMMMRLKLATSRDWVVENYLSGTIDSEEYDRKDKDFWKAMIKANTVDRQFGAMVVDFVKPQDNIVFKFIAPPTADMLVFPKRFNEDSIEDWLDERGLGGFLEEELTKETSKGTVLFLKRVPDTVEIDFQAEDEGVTVAYLK